MTKHKNFSSRSLLGIIVMALIWVTSAATPADALVAAGTQISNVATATYAESPTPVSSPPVITTVNLVAASPTLTFVEFASTPGSTAAVDSLEGPATVGLNYRLVGNSNGPDTYAFTSASTDVNAAAPGLPAITSTLLGAAVTDIGTTVPANTTTVLNVMTDSNTADGISHDIAVGDLIYFGGNVAPVTAIDETTNAYTIITVGAGLAAAPGQGVIISEAYDFTYTVTAGTITAFGSASSNAVTVTANSTTDVTKTGVQAPNPATINLVRPAVTIVKYVRNTITAGNNPTTPADINYATKDYWLAGVTGDSAVDTLEYLIVVTNSGTAPATNVQVTDTISLYLTLTTTSVDIDTNGSGGFDMTDAVANNAATVGPPLTAYVGVGGNAGTTTGGDIAAAGTSAVRFKAAIQ